VRAAPWELVENALRPDSTIYAEITSMRNANVFFTSSALRWEFLNEPRNQQIRSALPCFLGRPRRRCGFWVVFGSTLLQAATHHPWPEVLVLLPEPSSFPCSHPHLPSGSNSFDPAFDRDAAVEIK
jgi:hypothetical protein